MVYLSGDMALHGENVVLDRGFFFYKHRVDADVADVLHAQLKNSQARLGEILGPVELTRERCPRTGLHTLRLHAGTSTAADRDRVRRLQLRKPRPSIRAAVLPEPLPLAGLDRWLPFDLYAGSGVSYEAGLPTLCDMHDAFCLDDHDGHRFTFGAADQLPAWLATDASATFRRFCRLHVDALSAQPSTAQRTMADLFQRGLIGTVMSDNVDNLLCKVDVPFVRTRGSGVFNERFPAEFKTRTLVVVGVAADRREIVRQARAKRMNIVVVNPCTRVSPRVQHLNYVRAGDHFYRATAEQFFQALADELSGTPGTNR
ncbi:MAG TPA: hypothetical protein VKM00_01950 [Luteimonas sp.]|nr:hypothetical protein [Luteimonas sp.]